MATWSCVGCGQSFEPTGRELTAAEATLMHSIKMWINRHQLASDRIGDLEGALEAATRLIPHDRIHLSWEAGGLLFDKSCARCRIDSGDPLPAEGPRYETLTPYDGGAGLEGGSRGR